MPTANKDKDVKASASFLVVCILTSFYICFHFYIFLLLFLQATPDHTKKRKGGRRPAPKKDKDVKASASAEESDEEEEQEDCSAKPKCLKPVGKEVHNFLWFLEQNLKVLNIIR